MTIDEAQRIVEETLTDDVVWAGYLVPPSSLRVEPTAWAHSQTECLVERGAMATVTARLRFMHLTRRVRYERRREGTWVAAVEPVLGPDDLDGRRVVVVDVQVAMAELAEGLWSHHFAVAGATTTREEGRSGDSSSLVDLVSHPISGVIELRADPLQGPHGLIRLLVRVRNTTEPLVDIPDDPESAAHSMAGCHVIVTIDKGKFISPDDPPAFAEHFVNLCENENSRHVVLGGPAKILLSATLP